MFWGLIMEPKRRYTQEVQQSFHISMASLDVFSSTDEPAQVLLTYDNRNYLLCTLQKDKIVQCPLDLNFEAGDVIGFATNGGSNIHLSGYILDDEAVAADESASEDETVVKEETEGKRRKKNRANNEPPKKKSKTEELLDAHYDSNDDESFNLNKYLNEEAEEEEEEDSVADDSLEDDQVEEEEAADEESDGENEAEESDMSSLSDDEEKVELPPKMINGKDKKMKKLGANDLRASLGSHDKTEQQNKTPKQNKKENKTPKQDKVAKEVKTPKENKSPKEKSEISAKSPNQQTPHKRSIEGGVSIQDLKVGEGLVAKPGKLVQVYYEGRLKQNNKVFDKHLQGSGFKFRLGKREVIRGWDVGLNGMKVGGKRRIICPPNMAYGEKGSPPQIPPNSTLIFEVELKAMK